MTIKPHHNHKGSKTTATKTVLLGDVAEILGGGTPSTKKHEYWGGDIPWITPKDLSSHKDIYISGGGRSITELGLENSSAKLFPEETVIFSSRAPIGYVAIASQPMTTNQGCKGIVCNPKELNNKYLYYWLRYSKRKIEDVAGGSTFKEISTSGVRELEIELPPLKTQERIAEILGALDEKIELNRQMNATLENIGQALFRHHFIDNPEAKNWEEGSVDNLFEITMGVSPKGESYNSEGAGLPLLNGAADFIDGNIAPKRYTSTPVRISQIGDIIFCIRGTIGNVNIGYEEYCLGRGVAALTPSINCRSYVYFSTIRAIDEMEAAASGSVIRGLSKDDIAKRKVILPPNDVLASFESKALTILDKIKINSNQIQTLQTLRDSLLPRLMSGKIEV